MSGGMGQLLTPSALSAKRMEMRRATVGARWASFGNDDHLAIRLEREVLDDKSRGMFVL